MTRDVSAFLDVQIVDPSNLEFQIAVAELPGTTVTESLSFRLDGRDITPTVIRTETGGRIHRFDCDRGTLIVDYRARIEGDADPVPVVERDLSTYLRPSRYSESDKFLGFAATEFGKYTSDADVLERVSAWVGRRLNYVPGSSDPIDGATDTLLAGSGVCRDYTHLVVALLRAMTVPARLVAVYAPGCDPMDFHAVAEAYVDGAWRVVDATRLAPRQSLVRIATGRDAADTAFLDNHDGYILLNRMQVMATVDGNLPYDDVTELVSMR
ncbi:transglutaminase [Rhodococcus sp. Leaf7]|uniref:transglutaminase-like domain-containing protein n=1 Tax=unclassified Rhodococcus (in: high G+C Gram-positive bacteria) TaxID=192944 RepID=UPI0006F7DCC3|nr:MULTISPECIES: transglutaminase family protein [unclassified Rhodococcus (in: high G+C Gram-positive bacteria)]KQU04618.1 transglutaminase [Rhodococcus sp. Leaf7]KQU40804.1 transglutaminase [Rhodococcus sp. Leaf247]